MPIAAVAALALGLVVRPIILNNATEQQLARNVFLSAIPFILIFASIVLAFMTLIWFIASRLNDRVAPGAYGAIEKALIGGIVLGVAFIFSRGCSHCSKSDSSAFSFQRLLTSCGATYGRGRWPGRPRSVGRRATRTRGKTLHDR
jgi:hypothetical protein